MFPHITLACRGVVFESVELVRKLIGRAKTSKGFGVVVNVMDKVHETGKKISE